MIGGLSHYSWGFNQGGAGFLPSTVLLDITLQIILLGGLNRKSMNCELYIVARICICILLDPFYGVLG